MRTLLLLLLLCVTALVGVDKPAAEPKKDVMISAEDKLALREAQVAAQQAQLAVLDLANKIMQASARLTDQQKASQDLQTAFGNKANEIAEKLRKESGCKECVMNEKLEFVKPEAPPAPPAQK